MWCMWWNLVRFVQHRLVAYFGDPTSLYLDPGEHPHCLRTLGGTLGRLETVVLTHKELNCYLQNKTETWGLPGGAVVENLPTNAGDTGSSPGLGRSHMPRSSWAHEPQLLSLRLWSLCSAAREAAIVRGPRTVMKSGPHLLQLEKALAQKRRPNTAINK